jgi:hypothetical protein
VEDYENEAKGIERKARFLIFLSGN